MTRCSVGSPDSISKPMASSTKEENLSYCAPSSKRDNVKKRSFHCDHLLLNLTAFPVWTGTYRNLPPTSPGVGALFAPQLKYPGTLSITEERDKTPVGL